LINIISVPELSLLASLEATTFRYFGGPNLNHFQSAPCIVLATSDSSLEINGDVLFASFQGFPNEYSKFVVQLARPNIVEQCEKEGNTFLFHAGQVIQNVIVVEETVTEIVGGNISWEYVTDVAIVLVFELGAITISKLHHHHEVLHVSHTDLVTELETPITDSFFEDDLITRHQVSRRTLSLDQAMLRRG
jgi:hypothetical protein